MLRLGVALIAALTMGGWAVVTVKDLPEYFVAGHRYTIEFQVRQHGKTLLNGLQPRLVVSSEERHDETIPAVARSSEGTYAVTFTAPAAERVFLTIKSGFGNSELRLYPQPVVPAGASRPAMAAAERGLVLFVAKGCNACHANGDLPNRPENQHIAVGPELGGRRLLRQSVIEKVKHPASQLMPDLGLTDIEALSIATFLGH